MVAALTVAVMELPAAAMAVDWLTLVSTVLLTRALMLVHGASTMSSWSRPIMLAPRALSTPMTRKPTFCMRISRPIGD